MNIDFQTAILIALLLAAIGAIVFLVRRANATPARSESDKQFEELALRLKLLSEGQNQLTNQVQERLDAVSQRLGQGMVESSEKTAKSLGELQQRLHTIDKAQENITKLSNDVVGLQDILANKQARGAFGEIQLNDLVTSILPPSAYDMQVTLSNNCRADCLIKLPNPPGSIAVDAKFPLESYAALRNASSDEARKAAERRFRTDIMKHVDDIAGKYILPGETADSALMFLPSEAVYAELHANFRDLVEKSFQAKVWIVSPTTLMATLNTVRAILKDAQMREQASLIQREIAKLLVDIGRLDGRTENLMRHFRLAEKDLNELQTSSRKITSRAQKIEEFELEEEHQVLVPDQPTKAVNEA